MAGIFIEIVGDASKFKSELDKAVNATSNANSGFKKMQRIAGVAGLALAGGLAVGLEKSVAAAIDAQDSQRRLEQSFRNTGLSMGTYTKAIQGAQAAGRKLGFTDTETRDSLGSLITATGNVAESMKDMTVAQDLARFTGKDLVTTTKMMTMAMTGSQRAIKALGLNVSPVTANVDKLKAAHVNLATAAGKAELAHAKLLDKMATGNAVIAAAGSAARGQGQAFADTAAGGMAQYRAQLDHLEVTMGEKLLPAITKVLEVVGRFVTFLSEHQNVAMAFGIGLGVLATALLAVAAATTIAEIAMSPLLVPVLAAIAAIGILSFVVYKLVSDFKANWPLLLPIVLGPLGAIIAAVIHWHSQITGAFTAAWNTVKSVTMAGVNAVVATVRGAIGAATSAAAAVGHGILSGIMSVVNTIDNKVKAAFGAVWAALSGFVGRALSEGAAIGAAIMHGIANGIKGALGSAIGAIENAGSSILGHAKSFLHIGSPSLLFAVEVGVPISQGIALGIKAHEPKLINQMRSTLGKLTGAAVDYSLGAGTINLFDAGENLRDALHGGFTGKLSMLADGIAAAKANADDYVDTTGVDNMSGKGQIMAKALSGGFSGALASVGDLGAFATSLTPGGLTGAALVNAPDQQGLGRLAAVPNVNVTINGPALGTTAAEVADTIRRELLRTQSRNGSVGFN